MLLIHLLFQNDRCLSLLSALIRVNKDFIKINLIPYYFAIHSCYDIFIPELYGASFQLVYQNEINMKTKKGKSSKKIVSLIENYLMKVPKITLWMMLFAIGIILHPEIKGQESSITDKNICFIHYPNFPGAKSTWDDIGYNPIYNTVYIGVTNHIDSVGLFEYNVSKNTMVLKGFISELSHLRAFQWQGKVHSKIIADSDGAIFFSTDGGDMRQLDFMNGPHGYAGGYFMKWDPATENLTNLGMGLQFESLKDMDIDPGTGILYAVTFPQAHFIVYDTKTNNLRDLGRLGCAHVPRVLFTDRWGNCYYVDWRQRLVKYEKGINKLIFDKESLPAFSGTPGVNIITGITAYANNKDRSIIYLITYGGKLLAFHPEKTGIGKVDDLGGVFDASDKEQWDYYVPNLNYGNNGKLYYFIGGHGNFAIMNKTVLIEFDPISREKRIIFEYPTSKLAEATGSDLRDKDGNLYFAGRIEEMDLSANKAFMIKFNPEKEVK
jgi:hypothetical protein